jgi:HlyD family secretion protein
MNFIKSIFKFIFRAKVLIPLVLIALGVAGYMAYQKKAGEAKADRYRTAAVDRGPVVQRISANGTLNPVTVVNVGTQVSGTVVKLYTDFNKAVKANQVLLELDPALIKANMAQIDASLRSAEATMRLAESTFKRNSELVAKGFITPQTLETNTKEVDVAKAQVAQVRSQLDREKTNLSYTIIRSPIDGIVIDRKIDIGQTVAASFSTPTLFQIAKDLEAMQIDTSVAEADVGSVKEGMPVKFTVDAFPDRDFQGSIRLVRLNPTIQQNVVTYNVIVDVRNEGSVLKPGMTAQVSFVANQKQDVLRIPNSALRFRPVKDEKADRQKAEERAANKGSEKKIEKKSGAETTPAPSKVEDGKPGDTASGTGAQSPDRPRRAASRVYKIGANGELTTVEIRTGVASNQYTELISGELKAGDELVIRDLTDKNAKK